MKFKRQKYSRQGETFTVAKALTLLWLGASALVVGATFAFGLAVRARYPDSMYLWSWQLFWILTIPGFIATAVATVKTALYLKGNVAKSRKYPHLSEEDYFAIRSASFEEALELLSRDDSYPSPLYEAANDLVREEAVLIKEISKSSQLKPEMAAGFRQGVVEGFKEDAVELLEMIKKEDERRVEETRERARKSRERGRALGRRFNTSASEFQVGPDAALSDAKLRLEAERKARKELEMFEPRD